MALHQSHDDRLLEQQQQQMAMMSARIPKRSTSCGMGRIPSPHSTHTHNLLRRQLPPPTTSESQPNKHKQRSSTLEHRFANSLNRHPTPGLVALLQQIPDQISALLGDIVATRFVVVVVGGEEVVVDGRIRDSPVCSELCSGVRFAVRCKRSLIVGTSLEAKP